MLPAGTIENYTPRLFSAGATFDWKWWLLLLMPLPPLAICGLMLRRLRRRMLADGSSSGLK